MKKHAFPIVFSIALVACSSSSAPPAPSAAPAAPPTDSTQAAAAARRPLAAPQWAPADGTAENRVEAAIKNFDRRFDMADKDHDGYLSRDEANASMPMIARNFDKIDADHDGRLSKDEIHTYLQGRFEARAAAAPSPPAEK